MDRDSCKSQAIKEERLLFTLLLKQVLLIFILLLNFLIWGYVRSMQGFRDATGKIKHY